MSKRNVKELAIDHAEKKIIMNCNFAKRQSDTESAEFKRIQQLHLEFPDYKIVKKQVKKKENKEAYKGLTYEYMERYITARGDNAGMAKYNDLRFVSQCHSVRYPAIKKWFLETYPEIAQYGASNDLPPILEQSA